MAEMLGRYELLKKLATGGMGQVFLARQKGPVGFEKLVVLKRILPHLSEEEEFIHMFFDEARIAAALNHPNIAQIYELGEVEGTHYITMEYVHGESIRSVSTRATQQGGGLPLPLKCRIVADAAAGLDFAHRARTLSGQPLGLIHRDVSPQNILVGFNGSVKLIDFGVAKAANKISTTMTGAIKGKYAYMSPEQARGEELDPRSDVFGLGIVFFELLTHTRLFKRESETATLKAVVGARIPPPSSLVKNVPKAVDGIVLKALARKRAERFQSAAELQLAIEDFLVRQRLPATTAHLAAFMRELYGEDARAEALLAPEPRERTPSRSRGAGRATRAESPGPRGSTPVTAEPPSSRSASQRAGSRSLRPPPRELLPDYVDLELRLASVRTQDTVRGAFFNAVFTAASKLSGAKAEQAVRTEVGAGPFLDTQAYPAADFLRALWKAAEVLAETCGNAERAFQELGGACAGALLLANQGLDRVTPAAAHTVLPSVLAALESTAGGARRVESAAAGSAALLFTADLLPPNFQSGLLAQAMSKLATVEPEVRVEKRTQDSVLFRLRWAPN